MVFILMQVAVSGHFSATPQSHTIVFHSIIYCIDFPPLRRFPRTFSTTLSIDLIHFETPPFLG